MVALVTVATKSHQIPHDVIRAISVAVMDVAGRVNRIEGRSAMTAPISLPRGDLVTERA